MHQPNTIGKISIFLVREGCHLWLAGTFNETGPSYEGVAKTPEQALAAALKAVGFHPSVEGSA